MTYFLCRVCDAAKVFERSYETYSVTHQLSIEPDRLLYLAVRLPVYETFFQRKFMISAVEKYQLRLMIYDVEEEVISQWR